MATPDLDQVTILSRVVVAGSAGWLVDVELSMVCGMMFSCCLFLLTSPDGVSTM